MQEGRSWAGRSFQEPAPCHLDSGPLKGLRGLAALPGGHATLAAARRAAGHELEPEEEGRVVDCRGLWA